LLEIEVSGFTDRYSCLHCTYGENNSRNCKKGKGCFRNGVGGWRCRWCDLFFPLSVDFWYRRSFAVVRDMSIFGLG